MLINIMNNSELLNTYRTLHPSYREHNLLSTRRIFTEIDEVLGRKEASISSRGEIHADGAAVLRLCFSIPLARRSKGSSYTDHVSGGLRQREH